MSLSAPRQGDDGVSAPERNVTDLDCSHEGFLTMTQQAMIDLQASMKTEKL
jgi:hypothetical protein